MGRYACFFSWEDSPHLDRTAREELAKSIPPHQRRARMEGVPYLGAGSIFPVPLPEVLEDAFIIPAHWPRCYGMDVGWNRTAAIWLAHNLDDDVVHGYSEHYMGQSEPVIHAHAIQGGGGGQERAPWIPGFIDPAANGRSQKDGSRLFKDYKDLGLNLTMADNSLESGIYEVWQRLSTGRLKFFRHLKNTQWEYNIYRRDDKGKVVKKNDHLMSALRYGLVSGLKKAVPVPTATSKGYSYDTFNGIPSGWMAS